VIPLPCRQKGGAPQLGAKGPHQRGPFGVRPEPDEGDDEDDGEQQADA
jgi:hypothetical protein